MRELCLCIPNSEVRDRRNADVKKIIPNAIEHGYTDMVIVNEDNKEPSIRHYVKKCIIGALSPESVACIVCPCMLLYPTYCRYVHFILMHFPVICMVCELNKCTLHSALEDTGVY